MTKPRDGWGSRKSPRKGKDITRTRVVVQKAGLVGVNWDGRKVSSSIYLMPPELLKDLGYWINKRIAFIVGPAKTNGEGWDSLCCWPGRGMFVVKLSLEDIPCPKKPSPSVPPPTPDSLLPERV